MSFIDCACAGLSRFFRSCWFHSPTIRPKRSTYLTQPSTCFLTIAHLGQAPHPLPPV